MSIVKGLYVIGRAERMGLGTMTEEFCQAMEPEKVIIIDCQNGRELFADRIANSVVRKARANPRYTKSWETAKEDLAGAKVVVGFETWYNDDIPKFCQRLEIKSCIFPMHEWSPPSVYASDVLLCLSPTDFAHVDKQSLHDKMRLSQRCNWPASPFIRQKCTKCSGEGCSESSQLHDVANRCDGSGFHRKVNWPPKTFVHLAGNASHNREGTREVMAAAKYLEGTGAELRVHASFELGQFGMVGGPITLCGPSENRAELFYNCDVLVQPRRLPGHSLPINEATGEGIPCIVLDLPDWDGFPYRVKAYLDGKFATGARLHDAWRCDPDVLGQLMRNLALGDDPMPYQLPPVLPTWRDFREQFWRWIK